MKNNIAICGMPRSGKTTKAMQLFNSFPGIAIFANTQWENYFPGVVTIQDFKQWNIKERRTVINPHDRAGLIPFIESLFKTQMDSKAGMQPIQIIIDEVFHYQDEGENALYTLRKLAVDGLRWNIQMIITAHMPQMVDAKIYKNVHVYYFYELNSATYDYFKKIWRIDLYPYAPFLAEAGKYNYLIYDMRHFYKGYGNTVKNKPVVDSDIKSKEPAGGALDADKTETTENPEK